MNKYLKSFLQRGLAFGGFGPIIIGIIHYIISLSVDNFSVSGPEIFSAVISTYILAFIHAGASVFNQIESWPIAKSILFHFLALYLSYTLCYIINSWIPFKWSVLLIFTGSFALVYAIVWITVLFFVKRASKELNSKLNK